MMPIDGIINDAKKTGSGSFRLPLPVWFYAAIFPVFRIIGMIIRYTVSYFPSGALKEMGVAPLVASGPAAAIFSSTVCLEKIQIGTVSK